MFKWIKFLLFGEESSSFTTTIEKTVVVVDFKPLDKEKSNVITSSLSSSNQFKYEEPLICKIHPNYTGETYPTNNCNVCWEICYKKRRWNNW